MVDTAQTFQQPDIERLEIGGVFATTFRLFGGAPLAFLLFGCLSQLAVLARLLLSPPTAPGFAKADALVLVGTFLLSFLLQTAVIHSAVRLRNEQTTSIGEALALGVRHYLPMAGTTLIYVLATYLGFFLLVVPGIIVALLFAVAVQVCAVEGFGPIASIKRSIFLTKGERWHIFGVYCLFFIPLMIVTFAITFGFSMRGHLVGGQLCLAAIQVATFPLVTIVSTVIYMELRRLKENVGVARIFD